MAKAVMLESCPSSTQSLDITDKVDGVTPYQQRRILNELRQYRIKNYNDDLDYVANIINEGHGNPTGCRKSNNTKKPKMVANQLHEGQSTPNSSTACKPAESTETRVGSHRMRRGKTSVAANAADTAALKTCAKKRE